MIHLTNHDGEGGLRPVDGFAAKAQAAGGSSRSPTRGARPDPDRARRPARILRGGKDEPCNSGQAVVEGLSRPPTPDRPTWGRSGAGVALCLRRGYRAMVFHVGALWRLNELGWLPKLDRVSSVSRVDHGRVLAHRWSQPPRRRRSRPGFEQAVVAPIRSSRARRSTSPPACRGSSSRAPSRASSPDATAASSSAGRPSSHCPIDRVSSSTRRTSSRASSGDSRSRTCGTTGLGRSLNPTRSSRSRSRRRRRSRRSSRR